MAKVTTISDDLDGSAGAETVRIRVGDDTVDIDLTPDNLAKLQKLVSPYFEKGRQVGNGAVSDTGKMREWLLANGHKPGEKGRISQELQDIYHKAQA